MGQKTAHFAACIEVDGHWIIFHVSELNVAFTSNLIVLTVNITVVYGGHVHLQLEYLHLADVIFWPIATDIVALMM